MLVAIGVFVVVFGVLSIKVWPTIVKGLKDREMKIRNSIEEAESAQKQAKAALAQYEANLAAARAEAQKMLDDAKTQQTAIANELKAKADVELSAMRDKAKRDIDAAKAAAIAEIHAHATNLATSMAAKILKREINPGDQARMIQESLQEMGAGRA
jgi:F-type H+-transporting ATPase subunit b